MGKVLQREYARHRGVSEKTVWLWKTRGQIVVTEDGYVDSEASDTLLAQRPTRARPVGTGPARANGDAKVRAEMKEGQNGEVPQNDPVPELPTPGANWSHAEAIRHKEIYNGLMRELEYRRAAGALVEAADVTRRLTSEYLVVTTALLGIRSKITPRATALPALEVVELYDGMIREVLTALGGGSDGRAQ